MFFARKFSQCAAVHGSHTQTHTRSGIDYSWRSQVEAGVSAARPLLNTHCRGLSGFFSGSFAKRAKLCSHFSEFAVETYKQSDWKCTTWLSCNFFFVSLLTSVDLAVASCHLPLEEFSRNVVDSHKAPLSARLISLSTSAQSFPGAVCLPTASPLRLSALLQGLLLERHSKSLSTVMFWVAKSAASFTLPDFGKGSTSSAVHQRTEITQNKLLCARCGLFGSLFRRSAKAHNQSWLVSSEKARKRRQTLFMPSHVFQLAYDTMKRRL